MDKNVDFKLGEMLMVFRKRAHLSKTEMAEYLKVTPATISNYETSKTELSYKKILKFKQILGDDFKNILKIIEDDGCFNGRICM